MKRVPIYNRDWARWGGFCASGSSVAPVTMG